MSEIGVRLTGDNAEFKRMLADSDAAALKFGTKIAGHVGDKLYGLRDVSRAVATALGLNIENIADHLARSLSGMSKAEEEAYKRSETLGKQIADQSIANARARLTEEQKYQLNVVETQRLERQIAALEPG